MSTQRKTIRKKIVTLLRAGKTAAGDNVVANRSWQAQHIAFPAIGVMTPSEHLEEHNQAPLEFKRTLVAQIEVMADGKNEDEAGDRVDDLCQQIENILGADDSMSGVADRIIPKSVEINFDSKGERTIAAAVMRFDVLYILGFPVNRFDQEQKDLTEIDADWNIGNEIAEDAQNKIAFP